MKRYVGAIFALLIASAIQGNLPHSIGVLGAKPDLVFVALVAFALTGEPEFGAVLGFVAGLVQGVAVGMSLGSFIVTRTIVGFLAGLANSRLFSENPLVPTLAVAGLTALCELIFVLANPQDSLTHALRIILGKSISNAIVMLLLSWLLHYFEVGRKIKLANARL